MFVLILVCGFMYGGVYPYVYVHVRVYARVAYTCGVHVWMCTCVSV